MKTLGTHYSIAIIALFLATIAASPLPLSADDNKSKTVITLPHEDILQKHLDVKEKHSPTDAIPESILLSIGDQINVFVFGVEELSRDLNIDANGYITMPLVGEIRAAGMDKTILENVIKQKLIDGGFYKAPLVSIELISQKPFYILGEVRTPGRYEFQADLNIFKAIAIAGGFTPRAAKNKIKIIRKVNNQRVEIDATEDTPIKPGDSIKIEQRFF